MLRSDRIAVKRRRLIKIILEIPEEWEWCIIEESPVLDVHLEVYTTQIFGPGSS